MTDSISNREWQKGVAQNPSSLFSVQGSVAAHFKILIANRTWVSELAVRV